MHEFFQTATMKQQLKIAIQKSGRLYDGSMRLLRDCGIRVENGYDQLKATATNFPVEILLLRNSDIPQYVEEGVAHLGIVGENLVVEKGRKVRVVQRLGFSRCRLSLAVPRGTNYQSLKDLQGKKIATSYPATVREVLKTAGIEAELHKISGSVEIAPNIGLADAIVDLVSSGNTLFKNGLREVETLLKSEACLVANASLEAPQAELLEELRFRIRSVLAARKSKYILLNAPDEQLPAIFELLPGMKSPTVLPLATKGWSSVHSVIGEEDFWEIIGQLKQCGAEGILVAPIEKMVV